MDSRQKIKAANDRRLAKVALVELEASQQRILRLQMEVEAKNRAIDCLVDNINRLNERIVARQQEVTKLEGMLAECQESHTDARTGPKSPAG